ncbi:hypothetical protein SDJN02_06491, partial [Cucurbita argyrosperma subsp. argyrosperma]
MDTSSSIQLQQNRSKWIPAYSRFVLRLHGTGPNGSGMVDLNSNDDHRNQLITAMRMGNNNECGSEMKFEVENIRFVVSKVSLIINSLSEEHMEVVNQIQGYMKMISRIEQFFEKTDKRNIEVYYDTNCTGTSQIENLPQYVKLMLGQGVAN